MIYIAKHPAEIGIYFQQGPSGWKSIQAIKNDFGATSICNAQMWNMSNGCTSYALKVRGTVRGTDNGSWIWGFGWQAGETAIHWDSADHMSRWDNYLGCEKIVVNGRYDAHQSAIKTYAGRRGRTALGVTDDGQIVLCATNDTEPMNLEELADKMICAGCRYAIMLDGGSSSQMICPEGTVQGKRLVQSFFWVREEPLEDRVAHLEADVAQLKKAVFK